MLFRSLDEHGCSWKPIVDAFAEKDLSEEIALKNARLAKILQANDYDFTNQQPILWTPSSSGDTDDGAAVQTTSD